MEKTGLIKEKRSQITLTSPSMCLPTHIIIRKYNILQMHELFYILTEINFDKYITTQNMDK